MPFKTSPTPRSSDRQRGRDFLARLGLVADWSTTPDPREELTALVLGWDTPERRRELPGIDAEWETRRIF
ncbi:MAG TPA: hypothetical protein VGH33_14765 [Isosphaeraceae bacterium]|jgi:hypothetical protein